MKSNVQRMPRVIGLALTLVLFAGIVIAQSPSPTPKPKATETPVTSATTGEDAGDYTVTGTVEVGYRGLRVDGDLNKYQSDLNYKTGPRLFDSSFLLQAKEGASSILESLLVTSTGWGADPNGQMRLSAQLPKWYRFDANYRRFKYFRFLNNFANPNWIFSPATFSVPPDPVTGDHGYHTLTQMGDFDLTLLPKNEKIKINIGFSPERFSGPAFTNYHFGGNEFNFVSNLKSRANDFRVGADGKLGPIDFSVLQGFRLFRDDSFARLGPTRGVNLNPAVAAYTSFNRTEPASGEVDYTRLSAHTTIAKKFDITARLVHSDATSSYVFNESFTGTNFNPRITGWPPTPPSATPNTLNLSQYNITGHTKRPNTLFDLGATLMATDKFRISNTFRVETFEITGSGLFSDFFSITRGTRTDTVSFSNLDATRITKYRKYQNTVEGDYQFNSRYSMHLGYRYGNRHIEESFNGYNFGSSGALPSPARTSEELVEDNHTHAILGGFKARPVNNWTLYFDAERGTADNVFTRIGNYNYTNIRAKSRYAPSRNLVFNLALITKNNANPSEIAGTSLQNFGVDYKSRIFTSSVDWTYNAHFALSGGYNYNWVNSDAVIDFAYLGAPSSINRGHALYFMRNHFVFIDATTRLHPRITLFTAYRINKDNGQGDRLQTPTGSPATLISSYPMSYQSPEARLAVRIHRRLDWNLGYQYYNYSESPLISVRPQNYHAHMPYTSLRVYFGRKE